MKVAIIGGGITGLTTALALHKCGVASAVYEQAKQINEIGAGILIQPNAIKVFNWLGITNEIRKAGIELNNMEITNEHLISFKKIKNKVVKDEEGNKNIAIHRGRLQNLLQAEVKKSTEIHLNKKYINHIAGTNGIKINFENGEENVDVLLGADGINSAVRKILFPESSLRNTKQVCWRGIAKLKLPSTLRKEGKEAWGKQIRFGYSPIAENEIYWFAVANEGQQQKAAEVGIKKYLSILFEDFTIIIREIIAHTDPSSIHETIVYDLNRLPVWHKDNICLMGDAAHATTPNMGQGACQGIEDAYYMSKLFPKTGPFNKHIFDQFESQRRKKVDYIVNTSWTFGKMAHSPFGQPIMKLLFKMTPKGVMNSQMKKLYSIDK